MFMSICMGACLHMCVLHRCVHSGRFAHTRMGELTHVCTCGVQRSVSIHLPPPPSILFFKTGSVPWISLSLSPDTRLWCRYTPGFFFSNLFNCCSHVCVFVSVYMSADACRGQRYLQMPLERELQTVLGMKLGFSIRVVCMHS